MRNDNLRTVTSAVCGALAVISIAAAQDVTNQDAQDGANAGNSGANAFPDSRIEQAINSELWEARAVDPNDVDVTVAQGVVTLSGTADSILEKERAVRIARMTRGVSSVVDRLTVAASERSDDALERDLLEAFVTDPATDSWEITPTVADGAVTLQGTVQSHAERRLAERVAKSVTGVRSVANRIAVDYDGSRTDGDIGADIRQLLEWDVRLDDNLIIVDVMGGDVTLAGSVASDYERNLAEALAWVPGAVSVDASRLDVEWWLTEEMQRDRAWTDLDDEEIRQAIERALFLDPRVASFNVHAAVEDGTVTLTGIVDNLKAKRAAAQTARNTVGIWRVRNFVKVQADNERSDIEIEADALAALDRNALIETEEIAVAVDDGEARLTGTVDTRFERAHAADVIARVNGITNVRNNLRVNYEGPDFSYDYEDWDPLLYDYDYDYDYEYHGVYSRTDAEIEADIEDELFWSPFVDADEVRVSVDDGVATLRGSVDDLSEWRTASENAFEGGAYQVRNRLSIEPD